MTSHRLIHPDVEKLLASVTTAPAWPSYAGVSQFVGTTTDGRCTVYVDPSLGAPALQNAQDLLADAPRIMKFNDDTFGTVGGHVDVIVFALGGMTDGTGGADHMGCDYTTGAQIEVCASFGRSDRVSALFEAELSECSMNNMLCGQSTGEALSRWCAMEVSGNALADFASAPYWFQNGMADWVDSTNPTDQDYPSIGCGMAFISYLLKSLTLAEVAQKMVSLGDVGTLAQISVTHQWTDFQSAIAALPTGVTSDDPFGALGVPAPVPAPTPTPTPSPGVSASEWVQLAIDAMIHGLLAGETATEIKADVDGIPT